MRNEFCYSNIFAYCLLVIIICVQPLAGQNFSKPGISGIDTVSILFPEIEYTERESKIEKSKTGYNVLISRNVADILKELIGGSNFVSKQVKILYDPSMSMQSIPGYYENAIIKFSQIRDSIKTFIKEGKMFPMIPGLRKLLEKTNTRYFFYVTGLAFGTSEATKQYYIAQKQMFQQLYQNTLVNDYQMQGLQLQLILVEAESGRILWYNYNNENNSDFDPLNKEDIRKLCLELLQPDWLQLFE